MTLPLMSRNLHTALGAGVGFVLADTVPPGKGFTLAAWGVVFLGFLVEDRLGRRFPRWTPAKVRISTLLIALALAAFGYSRGEENAWFALAAAPVWLAIVISRDMRRNADGHTT